MTNFLASMLQPLQPKQTAGRDKFSPLDSPLSPFSIHAWAAALQSVDRHPVPISHKSGHYVFPEPGLFVSPTADKKKAKLIETWMQIRAAWIVRVVHDGVSMSNQDWRDLLSTDLSNLSNLSANGDTKAMARREKICAKLKPTSSGPGVKF
jgi:hypothetical protein